MGITTIFRNGPVQIGSTTIGGIMSSDISSGLDIRGESVSGALGVQHQSIYGIKPRGSFATYDLSTALTACGSLGLSLSSSPLYFYATLLDVNTGQPAAGSSHSKYTLRAGILYPASLTCEHGGDAILTYNYLLVYDGVNVPVVRGTAALPSAANDTRWTLSTASVGGVGTNHVRRVEVDFGIRVNSEGSDGDAYDTAIVVDAIAPKVTLTGVNLAWFTTIGLTGASGAGSSVTFRDRANGGIFGTGSLALGFAGLVSSPDVLRAKNRGAAECTVVCDITYDGTNAPITVT